MDLFLLGVVIVLGFIVREVVRFYFPQNSKKFPPGPRGYPLIGYFTSRGKSHLELTELANKHGPILSYSSFGTRVYVLSSPSALKEAFTKNGDAYNERFAGRSELVLDQRGGNYGLLLNYGDQWRNHRRFSLSSLRDLGFGKPVLESGILDEGEYLCEEMLKMEGGPQDLQFVITKAVSNIIARLIFGNRYEYTDLTIYELIQKINHQSANVDLIRGLGMLKFVFLFKNFHSIYKTNKRTALEIQAEIQKLIKRKEQTFNSKLESSCYIDSFLLEREKRGEVEFDDTQLLMAANDLFAAGTETTSTTLRWALLIAALYPKHQKKIQEEIHEIMGPDSTPTFADRCKLPLTEAFLIEVQRVTALVPLIVRCAAKDTRISSFEIPAGSPVVMNIWSCLHDAQSFPDPYEFNPERFLDANGKLTKIPAAFVPFGMGKRACLGESLAKMELSLFFTMLIQRMSFSLNPDEPRPTLEHNAGITLSPLPHKLIVKSIIAPFKG